MDIIAKGMNNSLIPVYFSLTPFEELSAFAFVAFNLSSVKGEQAQFDLVRPIDTGVLTFYLQFISAPKPGMEFSDFTYNNQVYENCLISNFYNFKVTKMVWCKGTGLIYYSLDDGREFFFTGESIPDPRYD